MNGMGEWQYTTSQLSTPPVYSPSSASLPLARIPAHQSRRASPMCGCKRASCSRASFSCFASLAESFPACPVPCRSRRKLKHALQLLPRVSSSTRKSNLTARHADLPAFPIPRVAIAPIFTRGRRCSRVAPDQFFALLYGINYGTTAVDSSADSRREAMDQWTSIAVGAAAVDSWPKTCTRILTHGADSKTRTKCRTDRLLAENSWLK